MVDFDPALSLVQQLALLGQRFAGVSLEFRRWGTDWPEGWRVKVYSSKHGRARVTAYGATPELAIARAVELIESGFE